MKRLLLSAVLGVSLPALTAAQAKPTSRAEPAGASVNYGNNAAAESHVHP